LEALCFVLREIASGENGNPLMALEAQRRAQAVLVECGYTWPGRPVPPEPMATAHQSFKTENKLKNARRMSRRRTEWRRILTIQQIMTAWNLIWSAWNKFDEFEFHSLGGRELDVHPEISA
jgi:hypothetical protein